MVQHLDKKIGIPSSLKLADVLSVYPFRVLHTHDWPDAGDSYSILQCHTTNSGNAEHKTDNFEMKRLMLHRHFDFHRDLDNPYVSAFLFVVLIFFFSLIFSLFLFLFHFSLCYFIDLHLWVLFVLLYAYVIPSNVNIELLLFFFLRRNQLLLMGAKLSNCI